MLKEKFQSLKGKKLLYLGGIKRAAYVVQRARELGIYVIVADYNEDSPAKFVANEGVLIDALDVDALVRFCADRRIDGILTGYADILLPVCLKVSQQANIPFYATEDMIKASTNKDFFKHICADYGVPVPKTYSEACSLPEDCDKLEYPVFIKPMDASGSRGADLCGGQEEFPEKYNYAMRFSKKKSVTVEEYLTGTEFILDYLLIDGEPHLLSMADRYSIEGRGPAINSCNLMILPSKNLAKYSAEVDPKVRNMFQGLGFQDGLIFMQGFGSPKRIAFYEMGCRLGGTWPYIDEYYTGLNPMDALFCRCLTGKMLPEEASCEISAFFNGKAAVIYFLAKNPEGKIAKIKGVDQLESYPWVVNVMQFYDEGTSYDLDRQTDVRFLSVHLVADDMETLKQRIRLLYDEIDYLDENGESLLMEHYDVDALTGYN